MRTILTVLVFSVSSIALAQTPPPAPPPAPAPTAPGPTAQTPGSLSNVEVVAFDAAAKVMTVRGADGKDLVLKLEGTPVVGLIGVGKRVDVTFTGDKATAVTVR